MKPKPPRPPLPEILASELEIRPRQAAEALELFDAGNTLPFVARYRKEATGGLDEVQLRHLKERAQELRALEERKESVLDTIREQGVLTDELERAIRSARTRAEVDDLYLPYKPKRKTRGVRAVERGLEPLADGIWEGRLDDRKARGEANRFVDPAKEVPDPDSALQGARDIAAERISEDAGVREWLRRLARTKGTVRAKAARRKKGEENAKGKDEASKFQDYHDFSEPVSRIPSHRILAIRRGESEGALRWTVEMPEEEVLAGLERRLLAGRPARDEMTAAVHDAWRRLLRPATSGAVRTELSERAETEAIRVFGENLEELLLAPPAGERRVLGLDPGFRTGVKAATVSPTGAVLDTDTLYLHQEASFAQGVRRLVERHRPDFVAVGNGTASRETQEAVRQALDGADDSGRPHVVLVNEAGASVYSASELAREELPGLDVSLRGAVSIARRLQDPLAELVKIDPKSIGVGQYQHDVNEHRLQDRLDQVVEICVNRVGVEVNTASIPLLSYVAGIGPTLARRIQELRDERGGLGSRKELLEVPRLGPKAFEQAAGFLRIRDGDHPLDRTAVHPERYPLVERMARDRGLSVEELVGNEEALTRIPLDEYVGGDVGRPTMEDILEELRRPGRDPREEFEPPAFREDVRSLEDLEVGMRLEGVVTNVVAFGAFVDLGVHQDGLVHISQLADRFVKDPREVVHVGQRVRVRVVSVEPERGRIGLSMKAVKS